jgi:hypothetical protein
MNPENLKELYQDIALVFEKNPKLSGGIITSYEQFKNFIGPLEKGGAVGGGFEASLRGEHAIRKSTPFYNGGTPCNFFKKSIV